MKPIYTYYLVIEDYLMAEKENYKSISWCSKFIFTKLRLKNMKEVTYIIKISLMYQQLVNWNKNKAGPLVQQF